MGTAIVIFSYLAFLYFYFLPVIQRGCKKLIALNVICFAVSFILIMLNSLDLNIFNPLEYLLALTDKIHSNMLGG